MQLPDLLPSIPPSLSEQLRFRIVRRLSRIIKSNYNTQFGQTASELTEFRHAISGPISGTDNVVLFRSFRDTVQLTTYDSYAPLIARFSEKPCKESAVVDLLAPGLPDFLLRSSSTSGGLSKIFPRYGPSSGVGSSDTVSWTTADPLKRRTVAYVTYFWYDDQKIIESEDNSAVATLYVCDSIAMGRRMDWNLAPEKDREKMASFLFDHAAPYAAGFIQQWRSFLLIHVLFALSSKSLETIIVSFLNVFVDMIRHLDTEFDVIVDCIANGTIPDLDGIEDARPYLEMNISSSPERAAELRSLGRPSSQEGWCSRVWPNLRSIEAIASGSFASYIPIARRFLGPDIDILARGYVCTEAWIGPSYNPLELNQFKLNSVRTVIELLDIQKSDSINSLWEVEVGRQYELVLTTRDGLWRYRLGDVVEISGFDPMTGVPVVKFIERRNVVIRLPRCMLTEEKLRATMSSVVPSILADVVDWTTTIDDRHIPPTVGFFVELAGDQVPDLALVVEQILRELVRSNETLAQGFAHGVIRKPSVRLVRPGTFSDFRQLKHDEGSRAFGQFKVPVVLPKATYVAWFADRVVQES